MFEKGLYALLVNDANVGPAMGQQVYFSQLPKQAQFPAVVFHTIGNPADVTLDGTSNLQFRRLQADIVSGVDQLDARRLAKLVMGLLVDYSGTLADGTVIQSVVKNGDHDLPYDVGAKGYAFRVVLDLTFQIVEAA
jgi:hypothetical protein